MGINNEDVKKENRRGFLIAKVKGSDKLIKADDAKAGEKYCCPFCDCEMHLTHTPKGKAYYARVVGAKHSDSRCREIEKSGKAHSFAKDTPESLCEKLCHTPKERAKREAPTAQSVERNNSSEKFEDIAIDDSAYAIEQGFSSLNQISNYGLDSFNSEFRIKDDYVISDYILYYKWGQKFLNDNNELVEIGPRIIQARFLWSRYIGNNTRKFYFKVFWKQEQDGNKYNYLILIIEAQNKPADELLKKLCEKRPDENGKMKWKRREDVQDVLIASDDWILLSKEQCNKDGNFDDCLGGYYAIYTNPKQIYLIPSENDV